MHDQSAADGAQVIIDDRRAPKASTDEPAPCTAAAEACAEFAVGNGASRRDANFFREAAKWGRPIRPFRRTRLLPSRAKCGYPWPCLADVPLLDDTSSALAEPAECRRSAGRVPQSVGRVATEYRQSALPPSLPPFFPPFFSRVAQL